MVFILPENRQQNVMILNVFLSVCLYWSSSGVNFRANIISAVYEYLPTHARNCNLYADDTMLDATGKTIDEVTDSLQLEINKLVYGLNITI